MVIYIMIHLLLRTNVSLFFRLDPPTLGSDKVDTSPPNLELMSAFDATEFKVELLQCDRKSLMSASKPHEQIESH